jgi:hypothetical protein
MMNLFKLIMVGIFAVTFFVPPVQVSAASTTKVMIHIFEDGNEEEKDHLIKDSEIRIGRNLVKNEMDVVLSDDLNPGKILNQKDIEQVRRGSVEPMRKAAAANGAAYILSGKVRTTTQEETVMDIAMNKAVTSFIYRIINSATGKTLEMDSLSFVSVSRSERSAVNDTYEKLSTEITQRLISKIPKQISSADIKKLENYRLSLAPEPRPVPVAKTESSPAKPPPAPEKKTEPASQQIAVDASSQQLLAKADKQAKGPEIVILNPPPSRGFKMIHRNQEINIEGLAIDAEGIMEVRINGSIVPHNPDGRFNQPITLKPGENRFLVMAVNTRGSMSTKDFSIDSDKDNVPPEIVILRPQIHRGFQMTVKPQMTKVTVEGIIKDNDELLFARINETDLDLSEKGHFIHEIQLTEAQQNINIQAADLSGNISRKTFQIARGENVWAELTPGSNRKSHAKPVLWGLAIGVSKYTSSAINLRYADQDALKLENLFNNQVSHSFSEVHFKTLVNEQVTRNSIIESITTHLGKAAPDDIIFLFLAGHGIRHRQSGSYYFMPSDANFDNVLSNGLRMTDFDETIKILSGNVDKIIVAMDTCHSGALEVGTRSGGTTEDLAEVISAASGLYILSASKAGQVSLESEQFKLDPNFTGHGVFTYTMVKAMQGEGDYDQDGYVSLNEIFQFVSRQVPRLTEGQQHPYFRMQGTDLPFIKLN